MEAVLMLADMAANTSWLATPSKDKDLDQNLVTIKCRRRLEAQLAC